jgi:general stress protein YciG
MQDEERVRQRAHEIWEEAGRPDGQHDAHWEQARREIGAEGGEPAPAETSDKAAQKPSE